jgi:hypothetical protein
MAPALPSSAALGETVGIFYKSKPRVSGANFLKRLAFCGFAATPAALQASENFATGPAPGREHPITLWNDVQILIGMPFAQT